MIYIHSVRQAPCPYCGGRGFTYFSPSTWMGILPAPVTAVTCSNCGGRGTIPIQVSPAPHFPLDWTCSAR